MTVQTKRAAEAAPQLDQTKAPRIPSYAGPKGAPCRGDRCAAIQLLRRPYCSAEASAQ